MDNTTNITIVNGALHVENAHITYRNFRGESSQYNKNGDKSFSLIIPEEYAEMLQDNGWNLRIKPNLKGEGDFVTLKVKVKFNEGRPGIWLNSAGHTKRLYDDTVGMLDNSRITNIGMIIRPYDWEINGRSGRTAYLQSMECEQVVDEIMAKYIAQEMEQDVQDPNAGLNF